MNVLIVAAHPDDETLGCGATAARLADDGHHVHAAILGQGAAARLDDHGTVEAACAALERSARAAAAILGIFSMSFHGFPDNRFDAVDLLDLVRAVERLVRDTDPDIVLTHFPGDLNIDHALAFRAVLTALRPGCLGRVEKILAFEVPSSTQWAHGRLGGGFAPNVFVDVAGTLERKVAAMEAYGTESRPFPHPRSPRALRAAAGYWGSVAGLDAAEPFELVRWVRGPSGGAL